MKKFIEHAFSSPQGHFKVVKYLVDHVSQFPSDAELTRYIHTLADKELLKKCQRCMEVIVDAKERQAAEANKNATILLQEIDQEKVGGCGLDEGA